MEKQFFYFVLLAGFSIASISCSDDDGPNPPEASTLFFNCTLDGVAFETSTDSYSYAIDDTDSDVLRAYGSQANQTDAMYLEVPKALGNGTHALSEDVFSILVYNGQSYGTRSTHDDDPYIGAITINAESANVITGEFNFTLYNLSVEGDDIIVENGNFRVKIRD